jgi:hypothetical protein
MRYKEIIESTDSDRELFGDNVDVEQAWRNVARYMSWFPKVYTVLRQSGKIYGELKHRTGTSDPEFDEIVAVATPMERLLLTAELKKIAEITEWEYQRQRRVDETPEDDMFAHKEINRFFILGLSGVDYNSIEFGDIDRSSYPDLTGYVSYAEFKPGVVPAGTEMLNDEELEHLNDDLFRSGHMYDLMHSQLFGS